MVKVTPGRGTTSTRPRRSPYFVSSLAIRSSRRRWTAHSSAGTAGLIRKLPPPHLPPPPPPPPPPPAHRGRGGCGPATPFPRFRHTGSRGVAETRAALGRREEP